MTTVIEQIKTGVEAHLNGNLKAAESAYRTAISLDEQNATAYNNLGFVCAQLKRWGEAFECLNTALQLKPDYSMAHTNLGQVLLNMGQEQSGLEHLETAVQCDANNAQAWENLGQIKLRTGDPARAEYCWWRASQLQPENLQLYVQLATAIAAQQRYNESNRILSSVLNNDENCVNAWVQLGINHFLQTNLGASQQALQEALQHDVRNYRALKHLSLVAIASGKTVQAETLL
ncbi:MAG: tetratricopeptide repeat protein, partial [Reinekea sp.]